MKRQKNENEFMRDDWIGADEMKPKKFRVWIEQVNATYVDVKAKDKDEARIKGYAKWRREESHSRVYFNLFCPTDVQEVE